MRCNVCGRESNADARFCANCGARLHPEADTLFLHTSPSEAADVAVPPVAAPPPRDAPAQPAPRTAAWILAAVAVIGVGYVGYAGYRQLLPGPSPSAGVVATSPAPPPSPPAAIPAPESGEAKSEPPAEPAAAPSTITAAPPANVTAPTPSPPKPASARSRPAKPPPPAQPVAAAPPAPPAPPPPVAAAVVAEVPKPDRFQPLKDALARCKGRDLIGRAVCEQRARLQYCDGYWDQVPQCAGVGKLNPATN